MVTFYFPFFTIQVLQKSGNIGMTTVCIVERQQILVELDACKKSLIRIALFDRVEECEQPK